MGFYDSGWPKYVTAAERKRKAMRAMEKLKKKGGLVSPVCIEGRTIARTFWGKAWCENLERYSDYENRLPRGRTYVRNGSVLDLRITSGEIRATVSGSHLYEVLLKVAPLPKAHWDSICKDCSGGIESLVELLQGRLSKGVMERICQQKQGLFPSPAEIKPSCSCPDWADMCKHVAAVLYGIGARFDHQPELLFLLRAVDEKDLIAHASIATPLSQTGPSTSKVLAEDDLSAMFGLDMAQTAVFETAKPKRVPQKKTAPKTKTMTKATTKATAKKSAKSKARPRLKPPQH